MRLLRTRERRRPDASLATINLAFLLLVFFLMLARLAPPPPAEVRPPEGPQDTFAEADTRLWVTAGGEAFYSGKSGDEAVAAAAAAGQVTLVADGDLPGAAAAQMLARLAALGSTNVTLILSPPAEERP